MPGKSAGGADKSRTLRLAQRSTPRIAIVSPIVAQPSSQIALTIDVGRADALPSQSFVRLRGLPDVVSLSDGSGWAWIAVGSATCVADAEGEYSTGVRDTLSFRLTRRH